MSDISAAPLRRHRCLLGLFGHFWRAAVVAVHLFDDKADEEHSEEDGDDDDDDEEALAGRRQAVQRVLRLQIIDLVSSLLMQLVVGRSLGKSGHRFHCTEHLKVDLHSRNSL